ncbi:oligosaccharide flippase family protein [Microbacterium sp. NPDC090007]|uniref:oligosaccharide flippase family protein n=1 Tax=Microbacterium sp. NPDC090007 TaxID=3364204 RepID=UPI003828DEA6
MPTLESRAPRRGGALALLCAQWGKYAVQVGGIILLARLIDPADFGLVSLGLALAGFAAVLGDFGLSLAALRAPSLSPAQRDLLFWINTGVGVAAAAAVTVAAGPASAAFGDPRLASVLLLLAPAFALRSASVQYRVELNRSGRLGTLAAVEFCGDALGLVAAAVLAVNGYGVVGLSAQGTIAAAITLAAAVCCAGWMPRLPRRGVAVRSLLAFGGNTFVVHLLNYASANVGTVAVGAISGSGLLGLFSRANQLVNLPLEQLASPLTRIVIPALARANGADEVQDRLRRFQVLLCFPVLGYLSLLASTAAPAIHLILGAGWEPAAVFVPVLAVGAVFQTVGYVGYWAFVARGRPGLILGAEAVGRSVMIVLAVLWAPGGPLWVAGAIALGHAMVWVGSTFVFLPRAGISGLALARSATKAVAVFFAAWAGTTTFELAVASAWDPLPRLLALGGVWLVVAVTASALLTRSDLATIRDVIRPSRPDRG